MRADMSFPHFASIHGHLAYAFSYDLRTAENDFFFRSCTLDWSHKNVSQIIATNLLLLKHTLIQPAETQKDTPHYSTINVLGILFLAIFLKYMLIKLILINEELAYQPPPNWKIIFCWPVLHLPWTQNHKITYQPSLPFQLTKLQQKHTNATCCIAVYVSYVMSNGFATSIPGKQNHFCPNTTRLILVVLQNWLHKQSSSITAGVSLYN